GGSGGAGGAGGNAGGGGISNTGTVIMINSTVSGNAGAAGGTGGTGGTGFGSDGGIGTGGNGGGGGLGGPGITVTNSIVAQQASGADCGQAVTSGGHNLSSDSSCGFTQAGDLQNADPVLGPLASNGGPTQTMALLSGSPAIDAIPAANCT